MKRAATALLLALALPLAAQEVRILPADPQAGESFAVMAGYAFRGSCGFVTAATRLESSSVVVEPPRNPFGPRMSWCRMGASIAGLGAGAYVVSAPALPNENASFGQTSPFTIPVNVGQSTASAPQFRDLDGNWFDPAQAGWGINIVQGDSGALFGVVLTYAEIGAAGVYGSEWLVMPAGRWVTPTRFRGLLMASARPRTGLESTPSAVMVMGLATLDLLAQDRMRLTMQYVNYSGTWLAGEWTLRRFAF